MQQTGAPLSMPVGRASPDTRVCPLRLCTSPLPAAVNRILNEQLPPSSIVDYKAAALVRVPRPEDASTDDLTRLALGAAADASGAV